MPEQKIDRRTALTQILFGLLNGKATLKSLLEYSDVNLTEELIFVYSVTTALDARLGDGVDITIDVGGVNQEVLEAISNDETLSFILEVHAEIIKKYVNTEMDGEITERKANVIKSLAYKNLMNIFSVLSAEEKKKDMML